MVVFGTKSSGMPLWNTERRRKELHFGLPYTTSRQFPSFLKFAPDDSQLIAGMNNGPYAFIDVETGTLLNLLVVDSDYRTCTYIKYPTNPSDDPNNSKADHSQDIYLLKSNNSVGKFAIDSYKWEPGGSGHFGSIIGCALSNDEKYFFTVGSKGRIYKWSAFDSFNKELVYHSQGADIISAAFNDDRTYVAAGIESFQVKIVSLSPVRIKKKSELPEDDINYGEDALGYWYTTSEAFSTVNRKIVDKAATETNDRFYRDDQSVEIVDTGNYSPQQIAFSAYSTEKPSSLIVSGGSDNNVVEETFYIPLEKMFPLIRYKKNNNVERMKQNHLKKDILRISSPFFIDDGRKFIGIFKNAVYELGLTTLGAKRKLLVPGAGFLKRAVAISRLPLIVVSDSKGIFLIDYSKFEVLGNISYSKSIESMALSADGSFLAVASQTGKPGRAIKTLEVLAVPSLKMLAQINRGDSMVTCMTCSENGRTIYTGDNKGAVEVFQFYKELAD
jgi:WD40 repeat protein